MSARDIIVVGASAGGVEALVRLVGALPADLPATVLVILHLPPDAPSSLPAILGRAGPLPVAHARDGEALEYGRIYVAPPNCHLLVIDGHLRLVLGPRENGVRPAADVLFRSAARSFGQRVVGVVLSGTLRDGTLGLSAIRMRGGLAIVQDPDEALFGGMPNSALERDHVDYCLPVAEIASVLERLAREPSGPEPQREEVPMNAGSGPDAYKLDGDETHLVSQKRQGQASGLTCPDCHGSLWELRDGQLVRLECRVGHAHSVESFLSHQAVYFEEAMWTAVNTLEERAAILREQAGRQPADSWLGARYRERAAELDEQAQAVRQLLYRFVRSHESPGASQA